MAGGKEIRTKIKSIENTQKITKAMEMVAASKMRRAQERMRAARPSAAQLRCFRHDIAAHTPEKCQPLGANHRQIDFNVLILPARHGVDCSSEQIDVQPAAKAPVA